jgi:hypothetical protein
MPGWLVWASRSHCQQVEEEIQMSNAPLEPALFFRHMVIDTDPPGTHHDVTLIHDLNGNGLNDIVIGGKVGSPNLFWYENPYWTRHAMNTAPELEAGGVILDVNRNGRPDMVIGQQIRSHELYWFENPEDPTAPWPRHVIEDRYEKYHDQAVGDVDGDGAPELLFLSQQAGILAYYDLPADPYVSPWPAEGFHLVDEGLFDVEGLVIADLDGDGRNEIVAGTGYYKRGERGWERTAVIEGLVKTRVAVADLDGDGQRDLIFCEGESHPGRLLWCRGPDWVVHALRDDLFHPHSVAVADFNGNGLPDIFVAEMGLGQNPDPEMIIYVNQGGGRFREWVFQRGVPTHEAKIGDLTGNGRPDIVGKPYQPERHIDVWLNE